MGFLGSFYDTFSSQAAAFSLEAVPPKEAAP